MNVWIFHLNGVQFLSKREVLSDGPPYDDKLVGPRGRVGRGTNRKPIKQTLRVFDGGPNFRHVPGSLRVSYVHLVYDLVNSVRHRHLITGYIVRNKQTRQPQPVQTKYRLLTRTSEPQLVEMMT